MRAIFLTLFPGMIEPVLGQSMLKRAAENGLLDARVVNLRDFTHDRHQVADDAPYGGGPGMVLKPEPIFEAVDAVRRDVGAVRLLMPSPQGRPLTTAIARELALETRPLVFVCGHYEGIDERVRIGLAPEEISIGDYVVTGGELPALVIMDAAARWVPGVLGAAESVWEESFEGSLLEYPHYTRPAEYRGMAVPPVLLSGDHGAVAQWRRRQALLRTKRRRPELLVDAALSREERAWLVMTETDQPENDPPSQAVMPATGRQQTKERGHESD
ncbi:MAG: tRNA (guanosine(37)-N1)-methyltransferase TrmD [Nitrospirae bacterium]|nr:tRNA (guanosine(37)-N1)-methyltransferase TrmD [Nitrospirota bacterium]